MNSTPASLKEIKDMFTLIRFLLFLLSSSELFQLLALASSNEFKYCSKQQAAVLLNLRQSHGNTPSLNSWNPSADCCSWPGVRCDYNRRTVTELSINSDASLIGKIPPSIAKLTNLTSLRIFANPQLSGTIPKSLCRLTKLVVLDLSANNLTGPIPGCFGTNLARIDLSRNRLSGPIPVNFMRGVKLGTSLSPSPNWLLLNQNQLTGPIPRSLGDVPLNKINLSQNRLAGDASFLFGEEKSYLEVLDLSENELEFDVSNVKVPWRLQVLDLRRNKLHGSISEQVSRLGMLMSFNVSYNNLCGSIPAVGFMSKFDESSFEHNKCLCGGPLRPCSEDYGRSI